jgi:hypothetical protein
MRAREKLVPFFSNNDEGTYVTNQQLGSSTTLFAEVARPRISPAPQNRPKSRGVAPDAKAVASVYSRCGPQFETHFRAQIVSRTANLSPDAQKIAKSCIHLAVQEQTRGAEAEIDGIWTLMRSSETRKRVQGFLRNLDR